MSSLLIVEYLPKNSKLEAFLNAPLRVEFIASLLSGLLAPNLTISSILAQFCTKAFVSAIVLFLFSS